MMGLRSSSVGLLALTFGLVIALLTGCCLASLEKKFFKNFPKNFPKNFKSSTTADCPCSRPSLCDAITTPARKEIFAFWVGGANWMKYDWDILTTVVMFGHYNESLMCYAHAKGVRVTLLGSFPAANLSSDSDRLKWIASQVSTAIANHMDGINLDIEYPLDAANASLLTALVAETTSAYHSAIPGSQVTFDVAWSPACIDGRCYDYKGIADACDFLFVMSYDEQSQIYGDCIAMANSPFDKTSNGIDSYIKIGISPNQLVLGVPWYGYDYKCISLSESNVCSIPHVAFRGAPCSDAAGSQRDYSDVMKLLANNATTAVLFNSTYLAPYFNYKDSESNEIHQVWFDDPFSLGMRYLYAFNIPLRGVGMWNADSLDYSANSQAQAQTKAMWDSISNPVKKQ